jgi:SHS2 domain-containing protein
MKHFEFVDHTADIIVRAYGQSPAEAFAAAADGLFAIITGECDIAGSEPVQFELESIDLEGLLVCFLSHLIVLHETEHTVLSDFDVKFAGDKALSARCKAEPFDEDRHGQGTQVKGVSYHLIEIGTVEQERAHYVQVLLDI